MKLVSRTIDGNEIRLTYVPNKLVAINRMCVCRQHPHVQITWCEVRVADQITHMGPYHWFSEYGGMQLFVLANFSIMVILQVDGDATVINDVEFFDTAGCMIV